MNRAWERGMVSNDHVCLRLLQESELCQVQVHRSYRGYR